MNSSTAVMAVLVKIRGTQDDQYQRSRCASRRGNNVFEMTASSAYLLVTVPIHDCQKQ
jgi:hypothetical protein